MTVLVFKIEDEVRDHEHLDATSTSLLLNMLFWGGGRILREHANMKAFPVDVN